eukprot:c36214_g1_i1 orf=147-350(+)
MYQCVTKRERECVQVGRHQYAQTSYAVITIQMTTLLQCSPICSNLIGSDNYPDDYTSSMQSYMLKPH